MNTKQIRKEAIALQLGELFKHTCTYSSDSPARWGLIEPDIYALAQFRQDLAFLAGRHFLDDLNEKNVHQVLDFCNKIGRRCGHVLGDGWTTGTWGVRISALENILKILDLPDLELPKVGTARTVYEVPCKITGYKVTENWLWVTYSPDDPEVYQIEKSISWKEFGTAWI
jgi:hypothetical protein